jgi:Rieske Fe-S protein
MKRRKVLLGIATAPGWLPLVCSAQAQSPTQAPAQANATAAGGPVRIPLSRLAAPWSSVEFTYASPSGAAVPGIIVRLADGTLYGASRVCPHLSCTVQYRTNAQEINDTFDVQVQNPAFACPCHFSVFDLAKNGKVVGRPAPRAPFRFELKVEGDHVAVVRLEGET